MSNSDTWFQVDRAVNVYYMKVQQGLQRQLVQKERVSESKGDV